MPPIDSVTQVGSSTSQRYPERFFSYLQGAGAADVLHNIGESGQTSGGLNGGQLTGALGYINDEDTDTAVVSIDIGGNDILGFRVDVPSLTEQAEPSGLSPRRIALRVVDHHCARDRA